ncbi:hypothetical protein GC169_02035 [bacterium]|nr:hypothetical protein [bacterium]
MDIYQLHSSLIEARGLISSTWEFFVSVHLALFGLLFILSGQKTPIVARLYLLAAYLGFMGMNYLAQVDNYAHAERLVALARALPSDRPENEAVFAVIDRANWVTRWLVHVYAGAATLGGLIILTAGLYGRREPD